MARYDILAVLLVSGYLIICYILIPYEPTTNFGMFMLFLSPLFILWMVYVVLKHGNYRGPKLGEKEFGYHDKMTDHKNCDL